MCFFQVVVRDAFTEADAYERKEDPSTSAGGKNPTLKSKNLFQVFIAKFSFFKGNI